VINNNLAVEGTFTVWKGAGAPPMTGKLA